MEVNIVVCDDESGIHRELAELFEQFFTKNGKRYHADYYTDPRVFLANALTDKSIDIVFMDIDMPKMNGFDAAAKMRATCGEEIILIFLTSMDNYVYESFAYQPF